MPNFASCLLKLLPAVLFVTVASVPAQEQAAEPQFIFETGVPPWKGERLELPPGFALDLGWNGVEHIRFAPGMFDPEAPDFFSYVIAFLLSADGEVSEGALREELLTYYRGLSKAVMRGKGLTVNAEAFTISLEKAESPGSVPASAQEVVTYTAILEWTEPFATQEAQTLYLEIFVWPHGDRPVVLSAVSPVARDQEIPWKQLREICSKFRLEP